MNVESAVKTLKGLNVKGWILTDHGYPLFALHIGPPGDVLLSNDVYSRTGRYTSSGLDESVSKSLEKFEKETGVYLIGKSSKNPSYADSFRFLEVLGFPSEIVDDYKFVQELFGDELFKAVWKRCLGQAKKIVTSDLKKKIAVKHIKNMMWPFFTETRDKFKLTDDEALEAFEDAMQELVVRSVTNS